MACKKVVFEDAGENKVVRGEVDFTDVDFIKVVEDNGKEVIINKKYVVWIRED